MTGSAFRKALPFFNLTGVASSPVHRLPTSEGSPVTNACFLPKNPLFYAIMSDKELPGFLKKRKLLYSTKDKDALNKYGDMFFQAGKIDDALDFYERGRSSEGFSKVQEVALHEGNLYLFRKVCKITKSELQKASLNQIGEKALELGKLAMALDAFKEAGNDTMRKKLEEMLNPQGSDAEETVS